VAHQHWTHCCSWPGTTAAPFTESLALETWAPYNYMYGYYDDPAATSSGTSNKRVTVVSDEGERVLDVLLPTNCVGVSQCAMQAKSELAKEVEEATLKFRCALRGRPTNRHRIVLCHLMHISIRTAFVAPRC
jgi:hypothetical protein